MLTLADILEALNQPRPQKATAAIPHAAIDSRQVEKGSLFIAIPGEKVDGHDFVANAFADGAAFALIEHKVSGNAKTLDLRNQLSQEGVEDLDAPLCLLVDNTIEALQEIARFGGTNLICA